MMRPFICALVVFTTLSAQAQSLSGRPIRLVSPGGPGSVLDIQVRLLADALQKELAQPVVVDAKPGAGGTLAVADVQNAAADGYTALATLDGPLTVFPAMYPDRARFDATKDFVAAGIVARGGCQVLVVHPSVPVTDFKSFITWTRQNPGKLDFASSGLGSPPHVAMEELKAAAALDVRHVPYRTGPPALTDLLAGRVTAMIPAVGLVKSAIEQKQLKALAVTAAQRCASMPGVPTVAEQGFPGFSSGELWLGVLLPRSTPPSQVTRLNTALGAVARNPAFEKAMQQQDLDAVSLDIAASNQLLTDSVASTRARIRALNVKWD